MSHARQQIREAVVAALDDLGTTENRVFTGRPWPLNKEERPGLVVLALTEESQPSSRDDAGLKLDRFVRIEVIGYDDGDDIDNRLDTIAAEVEAAIAAALAITASGLGALVKDMVPTGTANDVDEDGGKRAGAVTVSFTAHYRTTQADPETIIP